MRNMADVAPNETLAFLQKLVNASLAETEDFWGSMDDQSKLLPLLDITGTSSHNDLSNVPLIIYFAA